MIVALTASVSFAWATLTPIERTDSVFDPEKQAFLVVTWISTWSSEEDAPLVPFSWRMPTTVNAAA